ncbi:hypothetical protein WP1_003 [Pseudomonas phage WP1]
MDWKDIGSKIGAAAPALGSLLGGPAGAAAGAIVATALGSKADPASVASALDANPEALARLAELQSAERVRLQELAIQAEQNRLQPEQNQLQAELSQFAAEAADRDSARRPAAQQNDFVRPAITSTLLTGSILIIIAIFTFGREALMDPTSSVAIGTIIGYWPAGLKPAMAFYFGTTKDGSRQSTASIINAVKSQIQKESKE